MLSVKDVVRLQPSFTYHPIERKVVVSPIPFFIQKRLSKRTKTRRDSYMIEKSSTSRIAQGKKAITPQSDAQLVKSLRPIVEKINLNDRVIRDAFLNYYELLSAIIGRFAVYPSQAREEVVEGVSYISFILRNTGELGEVVVKQSSGNDILDSAAVSAIQNASPFPPLPIEIREREIRLNVPISFEFESDVW